MFSLVDKLVSSLSATIVGIAVTLIGLSTLPDTDTPYHDGMKGVVIALFVVLPMIAWIVTLIVMKRYTLTYEKMEEIQIVNYARKEAISAGMTKEDALEKYQHAQDVRDEEMEAAIVEV